MMRNFAIILVCVAGTGHGRRTRWENERLRSDTFQLCQHSDEADVMPCLSHASDAVASFIRPTGVTLGVPHLANRFLALALATNAPAVGWQGGANLCRLLNNHPSCHTADPVLPPLRVKAPPIMKKRNKVDMMRIAKNLERTRQLKVLQDQEEALKKQETLMKGERPPQSIEELYKFLEKKVGAEQAEKMIAAQAMKVAQKRVDVKLGSPFPVPANVAKFQAVFTGIQTTYPSFDELTAGRKYAVIIAMRDPILDTKERELLIDFSELPDLLDTAVIGLTATDMRAMSKFSRKRHLGIPLVSDPESEWLRLLNVMQGTKNQVVIFTIESSTKKVLNFLDGLGNNVPRDLLMKTVKDVIRNPPDIPDVTTSDDNAPALDTSTPPAPPEPRAPARPMTDIFSEPETPPQTNIDPYSTDLPPEWQFAAGSTQQQTNIDPYSTDLPPEWQFAAESTYEKPAPAPLADPFAWAKEPDLEGFDKRAPFGKVRTPTPSPAKTSFPGKPVSKAPVSPVSKPPPNTPVSPVSKSAPRAPLSELELENQRLKAALEEAKEREAASKMEAENAALKAMLKESMASNIANEAAVKAQAQADAAVAAAQRQRKAVEEDLVKKADAQRKKLRMEKDAAEKAAAQTQAEKASLLAEAEATKDAALAEAQAEKAALLAKLQAVQEAAEVEAKARIAAEEKARFEHEQAVAAGAAAQEAAEAAAKAASAAAELAAKQASAPSPAPEYPPRQQQSSRYTRGQHQQERRQYMLPGLYRVINLLNGTEGIKSVNASQVYSMPRSVMESKSITPQGVRDIYGIVKKAGDTAPDAGDSSDEASKVAASLSGGKLDQLVIKFDGVGYFGAIRLLASFENERGLRSQIVHVACKRGYTIAMLVELLKALQPVLNFAFDVGSGNFDVNGTVAEELMKLTDVLRNSDR